MSSQKQTIKRVAFVINAFAEELRGLNRDVSRVHTILTEPKLGGCENLGPPIHDCRSRTEFFEYLLPLLEDWNRSDQLLFYFAGHGEIRKGEQYCLKVGTNNTDFLPFSSLMSELDANGVNRAIIILDACHSGAATERRGDSNSGVFSAIKQEGIPRGIAIIASSKKTQTSLELPDGSHGVFTKLLCDGIENGLDGKATKDGLITVEDIVDYISEKLEKDDSYVEFRQRPVFSVHKADRAIWLTKNSSGTNERKARYQTSSYVRSPEELKLLYEKTLPTLHPSVNSRTDDLEWELIEDYFERVQKESHTRYSREEILIKLNLYSPIKHEGRDLLHKAAVLCFYKNPERLYHLSKSIFVDKGNSSSITFIREDIHGPLSEQIKILIEKVNKGLNKTSYIDSQGVRKEISEIDPSVVRELISNAISHRDYGVKAPVKVTLTEDFLEVQSPGKFPSSMTWDLLVTSPASISLPINAAISQYITHLLLFEGIGHGFDVFRQYITENGSDSLTCMVLPGPFTCIRAKRRSVEDLLPKSLSFEHNNQPHLQSKGSTLEKSLTSWFSALGYGRESYEVQAKDFFEWIITIPARRGYARVLIRGVVDEAGISDVQELHNSLLEHNVDEGWLISNRRISSAARKTVSEEALYESISCLTLDELLDQDADFSNYLDWLENEIKIRGIDRDYLPLACRKDEIDPISNRKIGVSYYGEEEGWIEGYVDKWLDDPTKEHLSILGQFGTGKTYFVLHYAWLGLQKYKEAKKRGVARPRLPLIIPLRDYSKSVSVESLFSEFFFRKHEIPIRGYAVFEQLNRMGKLLLIFDGFDEMAARVDRQAMIDNFWELAKVVVPGAKAILTCRTEHFPDAIEGRTLLNAELRASITDLTGESPQFEVLELAKLTNAQVAHLLKRKSQESTVQKIMSDPQLLDLARRPVMMDLILEALPDVEAGKPVDMSRVYLYAVTRKMVNDIRSERTFTSLADKLYFLCELSWEMLSTNRMSLNYRDFPEQLQQMFSNQIKEERDLDHWRYDMMGQTMLIRNSVGDYSPAHRSLLEFFVAYKVASELGILAEDFLLLARQQSFLDSSKAPQNYRWFDYFNRQESEHGVITSKSPLQKFSTESIQNLSYSFGQGVLPKAILELLVPMINKDDETIDCLSSILAQLKGEPKESVGYLGGNVVTLILEVDSSALKNKDLSNMILSGADLSKANLVNADFSFSDLSYSDFSYIFGEPLALSYSYDGRLFITADDEGYIRTWDQPSLLPGNTYMGHAASVQSVAISPDGNTLASASEDNT
ncbi:MAG: caspase family protein, partial [Cyanobacteria bacterium J06649_4]